MTDSDSFLKEDAVHAIIKSWDTQPDHWTWNNPDDKYTLDHVGSGIRVWVNTIHPYLYKPNKVVFGFWQRRKLRRAYRRWVRNKGRIIAQDIEGLACQYVIREIIMDNISIHRSTLCEKSRSLSKEVRR